MHHKLSLPVRYLAFFALLLLTLLFGSCRIGKYLDDGESMLIGNKVDVVMADGTNVGKEISSATSKKYSYIRQSPNKKILGVARIPVGIYTLSNPQKDNWWHRVLRSVGEAPVAYSPYEAEKSASQLQQLMKSKGCFDSRVYFDTLRLSRRRIQIQYTIEASRRYQIVSVTHSAQTPAVDSLLQANLKDCLVRSGDYYDQDAIVAERSRIVTLIRNNGYYDATEQLVHFYVDTTISDSLLTIDIEVQNPHVDTAVVPLERYRINRITVDSNAVGEGVVLRALRFMPGDRYNYTRVSSSYNTLLNLRTFNYVDISLTESAESRQGNRLLDAAVHLRNTTQQKISLSLELSNASPVGRSGSGNFITSGNLGIETVLNYQHKNIFGGAEALQVETNWLGEMPKNIFRNGSDGVRDVFTAFEFGTKVSLDLPLFLAPYSNRIRLTRTLPHTLFSVGGNYQYRSYFERVVFNTSFGYSWSTRARSSHQLFPVELAYVRIKDIDWSYFSGLVSGVMGSRIAYQFSDHLIMDARYDFTYSTQRFGSRDNFSFLHASAELAGNIFSLLAHLNNRTNDYGEYLVWNVPYSQYLRFSTEGKYYYYHGGRNTLVMRAIVGIGIPYGNSVMLPYEKGFFGGGPTTLRAWQIRRLGPGSYHPAVSGDMDRVGDIMLVANVEERFPVVGPFEGAFFVDMGNVWTARATEAYPDGAFQWDDFYRELALGAGLGLRLKISILTLRLDFAVPAYDPTYTSSRWRLTKLGWDNVVTNFGIDYPF